MKLALAVLVLAASARAELREIPSMADIVPAIDTSTLVVFDIDNTLVEPVGQLGSDQWYYYLVKAYQRDGMTPDAAETKAGEAWSRVLPTVKVKPVEAGTPDLIRAQQKRGVKVMALTARGIEDAATTFAQLKAIGVDMTATAPWKKDYKSAGKGAYTKGVYFMSEGPSKGETLLDFFAKTGLKPKRVVFADDKPKHAQSVERSLREAGFPVISFRYGATDAKVNFFNAMMEEASTRDGAELLFHGREPAKK